MEKQLTLTHGDLQLAATLHYPSLEHETQIADQSKKQVIVICHGFVGSRVGVDRLFVKAARAFAEQGNYVMRFDYAGCGESTGEYGQLGLDSMIDQTRTVIDYVYGIDCIDPSRITLLGHSLGGAIAIATAVRDKRVKSLILWSPVGYPFNDIVRIIGRDNYDQAIKSGSTDHLGYALTPVFFESLMQHQPFQSAIKFNGDVLLIHGTSDNVIPADYTFLYQKVFWTRHEGQCEKEIIFQADHTYSSQLHQEEAIRVSVNWLDHIEQKKQEWHHWSI